MISSPLSSITQSHSSNTDDKAADLQHICILLHIEQSYSWVNCDSLLGVILQLPAPIYRCKERSIQYIPNINDKMDGLLLSYFVTKSFLISVTSPHGEGGSIIYHNVYYTSAA